MYPYWWVTLPYKIAFSVLPGWKIITEIGISLSMIIVNIENVFDQLEHRFTTDDVFSFSAKCRRRRSFDFVSRTEEMEPSLPPWKMDTWPSSSKQVCFLILPLRQREAYCVLTSYNWMRAAVSKRAYVQEVTLNKIPVSLILAITK